MANKEDLKNLDAPINYPLTEKQALKVAASQCAARVSSVVAEKLVGVNQWSDQLRSFQNQLQREIYGFLSEK